MSDRYGTDLTHLVEDHSLNAILAWLAAAVLVGFALTALSRGDVTWGGFVLLVAILAIIPGPFYRSLTTTLPWELIALVAVAVGWRALVPTSDIALYAVVAGMGLLIGAELHLFTSARMSHRFVVLLVTIATMATAGAWALVSWGADAYLGTTYITTNTELMGDFIAASIAGLLAGVFFDVYVRWWEARLDRLTPMLTEDGGPLP